MVPGGRATLQKLAAKHGMTEVQVLLRWGIDQGVSVIPGCTSYGHLKEALQVAQMAPLSDDDLSALGGTVVMAVDARGREEL